MTKKGLAQYGLSEQESDPTFAYYTQLILDFQI